MGANNKRKGLNKKNIWVGFLIVMCLCILELGMARIYDENGLAHESGQRPTIYFCPKDNCSSHLALLIASASDSVHCAFFDINLKEVLSSLANKSRHADVKIVIDNENEKENSC